MGRKRLTNEEILSRYQDLKETVDYLKEKRAESSNDEEKNTYTKKIALAKKNLHQFSSIYRERIPQQIKKIDEPKQPVHVYRPSLKLKFKEIEEKANKMLQQTTDPTERQSILERLETCRLRLKYSY